jgi:hypothetical protein
MPAVQLKSRKTAPTVALDPPNPKLPKMGTASDGVGVRRSSAKTVATTLVKNRPMFPPIMGYAKPQYTENLRPSKQKKWIYPGERYSQLRNVAAHLNLGFGSLFVMQGRGFIRNSHPYIPTKKVDCPS